MSLTLGGIGGRAYQARILSVFAFYEFTIPLAGVWIGQQVATFIVAWTAWLGPALLAGLGGLAIKAGFGPRRDRAALAEAVTTWRGLMGLSAGLSIDNLVAGFSLGLGGMAPLALALTIMCCSVGFAWAGLRIGEAAHRDLEGPASIGSGVLLIVLAGALLAGWLQA